MINWGFRQFLERDIAKAGDTLAEADVWLGSQQRINIVAGNDITLLVPAIGKDEVRINVEYMTPLEAPIATGQEVAELVVTAPDMPEKRVPLVSDRDVEFGGFLPRLRASASVLFDMGLSRVQTLWE